MNNIKNNPLKYIKLFSIIYLVANFVVRIIHIIANTVASSYYLNFATLLGILISYLPFVLFVIYIFACYNKNKHHILLPIAFLISAFISLMTLFVNFTSLRYLGLYPRFYAFDIVLSFVFGIIALIFTIFYVVNCFSKFKQLKIVQKLSKVQIILSITSIVITIVLNLIMGRAITFITICSWLMNVTSLISLFTYYIFWKFGATATSTTLTENSLYDIKRQFDSGVITEEEYNQKRIEILNKL